MQSDIARQPALCFPAEVFATPVIPSLLGSAARVARAAVKACRLSISKPLERLKFSRRYDTSGRSSQDVTGPEGFFRRQHPLSREVPAAPQPFPKNLAGVCAQVDSSQQENEARHWQALFDP
jgi:hypothetical protein